MNGVTGANRTLLAALLATVAMLFTAFAAAYLERRAVPAEWARIPLPGIVWGSTLILLLSSGTLEAARRTGRQGLLHLTQVLGLLFLAGQAAAWLRLRDAGVFLPTSPHGSFFYVLSAVHGVHVVAGLVALAVTSRRPALLGLAAGFWHFMALVWLYVLFVLQVL